MKHLRCYLQAKDIPHNTCTEKQELVDLIKYNRQRPFIRLFNQQSTTAPARSSSPKPGPFSSFQNTVSSIANQVNSFASNVQDYVATTVNDALNTTVNDQPTTAAARSQPRTTAYNPTPPPPPPPQQQQQRPAAAAGTRTEQRVHRKSLSEIHNEGNIEDLNIRELKEILAANFVDFKGCVEKSELMEKVRRLYRDRQNAQTKGMSNNSLSFDLPLFSFQQKNLVNQQQVIPNYVKYVWMPWLIVSS